MGRQWIAPSADLHLRGMSEQRDRCPSANLAVSDHRIRNLENNRHHDAFQKEVLTVLKSVRIVFVLGEQVCQGSEECKGVGRPQFWRETGKCSDLSSFSVCSSVTFGKQRSFCSWYLGT